MKTIEAPSSRKKLNVISLIPASEFQTSPERDWTHSAMSLCVNLVIDNFSSLVSDTNKNQVGHYTEHADSPALRKRNTFSFQPGAPGWPQMFRVDIDSASQFQKVRLQWHRWYKAGCKSVTLDCPGQRACGHLSYWTEWVIHSLYLEWPGKQLRVLSNHTTTCL